MFTSRENVVLMQIQVCPRHTSWARESARERTSPSDTSYLDVFMYVNSHLFATTFFFVVLQMCFYADLFLCFHVRYE